jgi:hypothetical protein
MFGKDGRMRNGSVFWGIGLVLLGGLLLLQTTGMIAPGVNVWAIFWSLVLVLFGVNLLLRSTGRGAKLYHETREEPLNGARQAELRFHHGAGELRVDASATPDALFTGTFGGGIDARVQHSGDTARAELRTPADNFPMVGFTGAGELNWQVGLNPNLPLSLHFELGASHNLLDLRALQVKELRLQTGASRTEIDFPERAGSTRATIRSGAASVVLRVPAGVAARIHAQGGLASIQVDTQRFPRLGSDYASPDYDTAPNRLDIDVETGVGAVEVK